MWPARWTRWCGSTESLHASSASCHWSAIGPSDNGKGTEFTSRAILKWADKNAVPWLYIDPGKLQQNAFILRRGKRPTGAFPDPSSLYNGGLRDELLTEEIFRTLDDARRKLALWRYDHNAVRLHSSLGNQTPLEARRAPEQFEDSAPGALARPDRPDCQSQTRRLSL